MGTWFLFNVSSVICIFITVNQLHCFVEVSAWICAAAPTFWQSQTQDRVAPMADKSATPSHEPPHQQNQAPITQTRKEEG